MKKINKSGFVLIEILVVSVFMLTIFTFLYMNVLPMSGIYTKRYNYDDIDSVYGSHLIRLMILEDYYYDDIVDGIDTDSPIKDITDCSMFEDEVYCNLLKDKLSIKDNPTDNRLKGKIYLTKYELSALKRKIRFDNIFSQASEEGFRDYLNYLPRYTNSNVSSGYRVIIVRNVLEGDNYVQKYANIEVLR